MARCNVVVADPSAAPVPQQPSEVDFRDFLDLVASAYMLVKDPKAWLLEGLPTSENLDAPQNVELSREAARTLSGPSSQVIAIQVNPSQDLPERVRDFAPTSSLWLFPGDLRVWKSIDKVEEKDAGGKATGGKHTEWSLCATWHARYILFAEPRHEVMLDVPSRLDNCAPPVRDEPDLRAYLDNQMAALPRAWLEGIKADLSPHRVDRSRIVLMGRSSKMRKAYALVHQVPYILDHRRDGDWSAATKLWQEETDNPNERARAHWNLGIAAERAGAYADARREYEAVRPKWYGAGRYSQKALSELDLLMDAREKAELIPAEPGETWAVLPPAHGAGDAEVASRSQAYIEKGLEWLGCALIEPTQVAARMRILNASNSARLAKFSPQEINSGLHATYLVYPEYRGLKAKSPKEKSSIKIAIRLVEAQTGKTVWQRSQDSDTDYKAVARLLHDIPHERCRRADQR